MSWLNFYPDDNLKFHWPKLLTLTICFCLIFITVAYIYDLGIKQGQISALKTAYEVCKKVAPCQ